MALLFVLFPFLEIYAWYLFIERYSFLDALLFVISTGAIGLFITSMQGRATVFAVQNSLVQGKVPAREILHRGVVMIGGIFLMIPGLFSKFFGALMILPGSRHVMVLWIQIFMSKSVAAGNFKVFTNINLGKMGGFTTASSSSREREVIEVKPISIEKK